MLRIVVVGRHYWSGLLRKRISLFGCGEQQGVGGWGAHIQRALKGCISTIALRLKDSASHLQRG